MKGSLLLLGLLAAVAAVQASPYDSSRRFVSRLRANSNMGHPSDALLQRKRSALQAGPYSSYNGPSYKNQRAAQHQRGMRVEVNSAPYLKQKQEALHPKRRTVEVASAPLLRQKQHAQKAVLHQEPVEVASAPLLKQKQAAQHQRGRRVEVNSAPLLKQKQEALHPRNRPVDVASGAHLRQKQAAQQVRRRPVHTGAQLLEQKKAVHTVRRVEAEGAPLIEEKMRAIGGAKSLAPRDVEVTSNALIKQKEKGRFVDVASGQALRRKQDAQDKVAEIKRRAELKRLRELGFIRPAHPNAMLRPQRNPAKITPKSWLQEHPKRNPGKITMKDRILARLV